MNNKKALFFMNNLPHRDTAGGILYQQISESFGLENISFIGVSSNTGKRKKITHKDKQFFLQFPSSNIVWKIFKKTPLIEEFYTLCKYVIIRKKVFAAIKENNPEIILVQLRGDSLFFVNDILKKNNVPVIGMIEDTVEREIDGHYISYCIKKRLYYKAIPKIKKIGVAGETMKEYVQNKFSIPAITLRPWSKKGGYSKKNIDNVINIFFAGNIYAKKAFLLFLKALELFASKNQEYKINFIIASRKKINFKPKNFSLTHLGWLSEESLLDYMNKSHFAYLPYIFDENYKHSMTYAFPGKAGFYMTNNLPIFFHGPKYSSFNTFLKEYKVGVSCSSVSITDIYKSIEELLLDKMQYISFQNEINKAYQAEYSQEEFNKRIKMFFNI